MVYGEKQNIFLHTHLCFPLDCVPVEVSGEHGLLLAAALESSSMEVLFCAKNLLG